METMRGIDAADLKTTNPIDLFQQWLDAARITEPNDAEAMALASVGADGQPSVRMVLLKSVDEKGFLFFTNMESRKSHELAVFSRAGLCFHWKSKLQQVRVEGVAEWASDAEADAYFSTRHPLSRLGAWASRQSQELASRSELEERVKGFEKKFEGQEIPRPPHWGGWRIVPSKIEFWQQGEGRLHDRFLFTRTVGGWRVVRLNP